MGISPRKIWKKLGLYSENVGKSGKLMVSRSFCDSSDGLELDDLWLVYGCLW